MNFLNNVLASIVAAIIFSFLLIGFKYLVGLGSDVAMKLRIRGFILGLLGGAVLGTLGGAVIAMFMNLVQSLSGMLFGYEIMGIIFWFLLTPLALAVVSGMIFSYLSDEKNKFIMSAVILLSWAIAVGGSLLFSDVIQQPEKEAAMKVWLVYWMVCWAGGGGLMAISFLPAMLFLYPQKVIKK